MIVHRPALERRVAASLDASRTPVVLGGCGSGRTSLLMRLAQLIGKERSQYVDLAAAATTPERCLESIAGTSPFKPRNGQFRFSTDSPRGAFDGLLAFFDEAVAADGGPVTFLVDEVLDARTFESFPGLRQVQKELIARLATSRNRFVLASRFTARAHRLLRDAPARFEVVHLTPLDAQEVTSLALLFEGAQPGWASAAAPVVAALTGGRASYVQALLGALTQMGSASDPVAALAALCAPDGRITALCHHCYEFRLQRARGYGALKAILGVLAELEPLNLTEIAQRLHRTPGSTKDYLSWLEDVDLIVSHRKRYSFDDPLLRIHVRLYGRSVPPTDDDLVREIHTYAQSRLPRSPEPVGEPAMAAAEPGSRDSSIIDID
jgi:hypothetical protein